MIFSEKPLPTQRVRPEGLLFRIKLYPRRNGSGCRTIIPAMKEHRLKRPALVMELLLALAASLIAGMFAWYAVLVWRFLFD
jgi:hypothetical protein